MCVQYGRTPLFWACYHGHTEVVDLLQENGADVSICDEVYYYMSCIVIVHGLKQHVSMN